LFLTISQRLGNRLTGDNDAGVTYIFKRDGANWSFHQKIAEPEIGLYDDFGATVDISENYAMH
jgi:hypothetical protein